MPNQQSDPRRRQFVLEVTIVRLGEGYLASGTVGGMSVRGNRGPNPLAAVESLLMQYTQHVNPDAMLSLDLACSGEKLDTLLELDAGAEGPTDPDAPSEEFLKGVRFALNNPSVGNTPAPERAGVDD